MVKVEKIKLRLEERKTIKVLLKFQGRGISGVLIEHTKNLTKH